PKFLHYRARTALLTSVEFDHADIYRDEQAYVFAFARFINLIPSAGTLVAGWDSPVVRELAAKSFAPVQSFGFGGDYGAHGPSWEAINVQFGAEQTSFEVVHDGQPWGSVETPVAGAFNVRNCLAAIAAADAIGADQARVQEGLATFRSVRRRLEVRGTVAGVTVIDDFAHHPTAVSETIDAVRQRYPGRRIVAVFEPRSYTAQRKEFEGRYIDSFGGADAIVLAGLFHPERYTRETAIDPDTMVEAWQARGKAANYIPQVDDIVRFLDQRLSGGEIVLIMSNGGFGGIHGKLLNRLQARGS
ncbi:MAG TPA: Mur ligase family protein, partial [Longimicrobiales bacterium]|nr:Mur ligase family protein [Longimicrobiales bacterium]